MQAVVFVGMRVDGAMQEPRTCLHRPRGLSWSRQTSGRSLSPPPVENRKRPGKHAAGHMLEARFVWCDGRSGERSPISSTLAVAVEASEYGALAITTMHLWMSLSCATAVAGTTSGGRRPLLHGTQMRASGAASRVRCDLTDQCPVPTGTRVVCFETRCSLLGACSQSWCIRIEELEH